MSALGVVADLACRLGGVEELPGPGLHGWEESLQVFDGDGYKVGDVFFGGRTDVHVRSTSSAANAARQAVARVHGAKTSRVDTRVDTLLEFDALGEMLERAAASYGSLITRVESSVRGESKGRTIYLGAPTSAIRVRVYEKWLESPGQYVEGTNRVEVQLRPASRVKALVSTWEPIETFCASRTTRWLAEELAEEFVPVRRLHIAKGTPDLEQALEAMGNQYGRRAREHLERTGGDLDRLLEYVLTGGAETRSEQEQRVAEQAGQLRAAAPAGGWR